MKTSAENQLSVEHIMETFDFEKVHAYMTLTKHTWRGEDKSPTVEQLKSTALYVLHQVADSDIPTSSGTGGFRAFRMPYGISLSFDVCHKSNY
jgi:hypothetical protein